MKSYRYLSAMLLACALVVFSAKPASANVTIFTDFGDGNLDLDYGDSGAATLSGFYVLLSGTSGTADVISASGLGFSASASGDATGQLLVTFDIKNTTGVATAPMSFIAQVDANGDLTDRMDRPGGTHIVAGAGEPSRFSIDNLNSVSYNLSQDIQIGGQLDNTDSCGAFCNLDMALQWSIPSLSPGQVGRVVVSLADNGQHLSDSVLTATHVDTGGNLILPEQTLTFSGTVQVVPEPHAYWLMLAGLGLLGAFAGLRRRAAG